MENLNLEIIKLLYKKRVHILVITILGAFVAGGSSYLIKPRFKSSAAVYPANISPVSDETPTEQLMQFFTSSEVKETLRKRFDLGKHYGIDTTSDRFETYYGYYFDENIKISQTRFESIQLEVLDTDPKMAQDLAYGLIDAVNDHIRNQLNSKTMEFIKMHETYMATKKAKMDSTSAALRQLSKEYGILDYFIQIEQASKSYYKAIPTGNAGKLEQVMANLGDKGILYMSLLEQYKSDMGFFNESRQHIDKGWNDINKRFTYVTISSKPTLPEIKATPKRSVIVAIGTIGAFLFACLFFVVLDRVKKIKAQLA
jgi:LPS O-antigen subunit length determinant protein (WzzB/FepE family)